VVSFTTTTIGGNPLPPRGKIRYSVRSIISSPVTPHRYRVGIGWT